MKKTRAILNALCSYKFEEESEELRYFTDSQKECLDKCIKALTEVIKNNTIK